MGLPLGFKTQRFYRVRPTATREASLVELLGRAPTISCMVGTMCGVEAKSLSAMLLDSVCSRVVSAIHKKERQAARFLSPLLPLTFQIRHSWSNPPM